MRFPAAYYLLLLYCTVMLQPVALLVIDEISHCFNEAYHVATVHATQGADHVERQMAAQENPAKSVKYEKPGQEHHTPAKPLSFTAFQNFSSATFNEQPALSTCRIFIPFHSPPPLCLLFS